jgi:translation initiation factor 2-like protein
MRGGSVGFCTISREESLYCRFCARKEGPCFRPNHFPFLLQPSLPCLFLLPLHYYLVLWHSLMPPITRQSQPAAVKMFVIPQFSTPVSQKTFYKGDKVQLKWNDSGTALIVLAQTEVDKTGKSYYGETTLYLMSATGAFDSRIELGVFRPL